MLQHSSCIYRIGVPFAPVFFLRDLCVQDRTILSDKFSFFLSDLIHNVPILFAFGIVENIKDNCTTFALRFCNDAVFEFCALLDSNIVGSNPFQHIFAFSYVNKLIVQLDTVDTWVFILWCQASPAKHGTHIFHITVFQFITPFQHAASYAAQSSEGACSLEKGIS